MKSGNTKQIFVDEMVPKIFSEIKQKFDAKALVFTSEAWMRSSNKNELSDFEYENLPKIEIVMISIETAKGSEMSNYEIKREGKQVNSDGKFVDRVSLVKIPDEKGNIKNPIGRFSNLFSKLKN